MEAKKSETVRSWEIVFPNDTNPHGTMFGGKLMAIMDKIAAIAASRYAGKLAVTASTEAMDFKSPIYAGDRIQSFAKVVWTGRTSLVVKVDVYAENPVTQKRVHTTTAHFNFVALDEKGRPAEVPPLIVETEEEKHDFEVAEIVKRKALERKSSIEERGRQL